MTQYKQIRTFQIMKENSNKLEEIIKRQINNQMQKKQNNFAVKYGNKENNKNTEWINNMNKEIELEEGLEANTHLHS